MTTAKIALLADRGVVSVAGEDAAKLLQGVITNDMAAFDNGADAIFAGLLTPQGKILHEFFVVNDSSSPGNFLIETARERTADLVKRLSLYKLRAKADIKDVSPDHSVAVLWGDTTSVWPCPAARAKGTLPTAFADPRHPALGLRLIISMASDWVLGECGATPASAEDFHGHRIGLGVPEGGPDYTIGDAFPHEADFDLFGGVSFTKGCFVGQEVVARMQHKATVRKRVARVSGAALAPGLDVKLGEVTIGKIGSTSGQHGLALLRIDRVVEALDAGRSVTAGGEPLNVDPEAITRYRASLAEKADGP